MTWHFVIVIVQHYLFFVFFYIFSQNQNANILEMYLHPIDIIQKNLNNFIPEKKTINTAWFNKAD